MRYYEFGTARSNTPPCHLYRTSQTQVSSEPLALANKGPYDSTRHPLIRLYVEPSVPTRPCPRDRSSLSIKVGNHSPSRAVVLSESCTEAGGKLEKRCSAVKARSPSTPLRLAG